MPHGSTIAASVVMTADDNTHRVDTSTEVRARIEQALHTRSAPPGTAAAKLEHLVKREGEKLWVQLKKRPSLGVALAGATGLAVATAVGVGELAIGLIAGYAAYQILREGVAPKAVAKDILEKIERVG
jgi:hypothetical protein